jgi:hypothetical protein
MPYAYSRQIERDLVPEPRLRVYRSAPERIDVQKSRVRMNTIAKRHRREAPKGLHGLEAGSPGRRPLPEREREKLCDTGSAGNP